MKMFLNRMVLGLVWLYLLSNFLNIYNYYKLNNDNEALIDFKPSKMFLNAFEISKFRYKHIPLFSTETKVISLSSSEKKTEVFLDDIIIKTEGRLHSDESKAKISAANKGKTPWNAGVKHSEETKRKIAEKTREASLRKKTEKALALGLSLEEYSNMIEEEKKQKRLSKLKGGLTQEGRQKISESMKLRWASPGFKEIYTNVTKGSRNHSEETRTRISEAIKLKWQDEEYRLKERAKPSLEVRSRISQTLKTKWEDIEFREKMLNRSFERTNEWKMMISDKIKEKWLDPNYRSAVQTSVKAFFNSEEFLLKRTQRVRTTNRRSGGISKALLKTISEKEIKQRNEKIIKKHEENNKIRQQIYKKAKDIAKKKGKNTSSLDLKELLGGQLWFEEKLKRKRDGVLQDDTSLQQQLLMEWESEYQENHDEFVSEEFAEDDVDFQLYDENEDSEESEYKLNSSKTDFENDTDDYLDDSDLYEDDYVDEDMIEVYDENGVLVGVYDLQEFQRIKSNK